MDSSQAIESASNEIIKLRLYPQLVDLVKGLVLCSYCSIYNFCEEWHLAIDQIPESTFKELEKKAGTLRVLESRYGPFSVPESWKKNAVVEKRGKVEILKGMAEEEKTKHEKAVGVSRAMTVNNLQLGFPHMFQAMVGFPSVYEEGLRVGLQSS